MLTTIGHRFGHRSGLDESLRQNAAAISNGFVFRVSLVFQQQDANSKYYNYSQCLPKRCTFQTNCSVFYSTTPEWLRLGALICVQHANICQQPIKEKGQYAFIYIYIYTHRMTYSLHYID